MTRLCSSRPAARRTHLADAPARPDRRRLAARWLVNAITLCDGCRLNFVTVTGQILMAVHKGRQISGLQAQWPLLALTLAAGGTTSVFTDGSCCREWLDVGPWPEVLLDDGVRSSRSCRSPGNRGAY